MSSSVVPVWPSSLMLVRHAESAGNVARDLAESQGMASIDIALRDMDVALSPRGEGQAQALVSWLRDSSRTPEVVLASPYVRAEMTARLATEALEVDIVVDERLREREFGMLDRLTRLGIEQRYPEQAEARARLGKFYHRPPGGENWCDVALRVRSALDTISRQYAGRRVMVVSHEVVILMFCYVLQHLREADVLELSRAHPLANCSVTSFAADAGDVDMRLIEFGGVEAVERSDVSTTNEPDLAVAPR
jgi:broad specificity phosphatase PhoE